MTVEIRIYILKINKALYIIQKIQMDPTFKSPLIFFLSTSDIWYTKQCVQEMNEVDFHCMMNLSLFKWRGNSSLDRGAKDGFRDQG